MWHVLQLALAAVCGLARLSALPAPTARKPLSRRRSSSAAAGRERMPHASGSSNMYDRTSEPTYFPSGPLLLTGYITLEIGNTITMSHSVFPNDPFSCPLIPAGACGPSTNRVHSTTADCPSRREDQRGPSISSSISMRGRQLRVHLLSTGFGWRRHEEGNPWQDSWRRG